MNLSSTINSKYLLDDKIAELNNKYNSAQPYKHLVLDGFLADDVANLLYEHFPSMDSLKVKRKSLNEDKVEDYHFERWHPAFSQVREALRSEEWYGILEKITGIKGLHTTDDNLGSGLHQSANAGYVDVHVDVNVNPAKGLWRRINLLIYLNKGWKDEYGGHLEIWNKEMTKCYDKVLPGFNKAVLFYTDDNSPHGVSKVTVPEGQSRKSFYTYYFTPLEEGVKYRDSKFISRPDDSSWKKIATSSKEAVKIRVKKLLNAIGVKSLDFQDKN